MWRWQGVTAAVGVAQTRQHKREEAAVSLAAANEISADAAAAAAMLSELDGFFFAVMD